MTRLHKTLLGATVGLLAGAAIYEARRAGQLLEQLKAQEQENEQLRAGSESPSNRLTMLAQTNSGPGTALQNDRFAELLRLRGEVGRLRLLGLDCAQAVRNQEQAAQARVRVAQATLPGARAQLDRLTVLRSSDSVSEETLSQSKFRVELLEVEAKGDTREATRVRLRQAEEEFARAAELYSQRDISLEDYCEALCSVESLRAEAKGDRAEVARVQLRHAEKALRRAAGYREQGIISEEEYDAAVLRVESLEAGSGR